jgi:glycosyltransferase involved in cell wall biosynthesis
MVGVDASRAYSRDPTGTETYAARVIGGLQRRGRHRLRLYFRSRPPAERLPRGVEARVLIAPRLWTHTRLAAEVWRHPPDVLFVPSHVLPMGIRVPSVVTVHDLGHRAHPEAHTWAQRAYLDWSTRRHAKLATRVLVDSQSTRDDLIGWCPGCAGRVRVAPLGVDEDMVPAPAAAVTTARDAAGVPAGRQYVLHVGTLQPRKNLARLIAAWSSVCGAFPDVDLVLAGRPGWGGQDLRDLARRAGVVDRVRLAGYVPRAVLAGLYSGALALVHPSLYEGFGLTVLEAMACGTPVAAARRSSIPEVVGDAGLLFDPLDSDAIATAVRQLLSDQGLRASLARAGLARAAAFTWDRCARVAEAAIEEAAQG